MVNINVSPKLISKLPVLTVHGRLWRQKSAHLLSRQLLTSF